MKLTGKCSDKSRNRGPGKFIGIFLFAAAVALFAVIFLSSCSSDSSTNTTTTTTGSVDKFLNTMKNQNFYVQEGKGMNIDILKLCSEGYFPSCYGQNKGAAYCILTVPPAPGQDPAKWQDPPVDYNPEDSGNYPANPDFYPPGAMYKLRTDEAVVYIGKTPPECTYFSFIPYITLTENKPGKDYSDVYTTGNDKVGFYHRIFGSLTDPLNNFTIKTSGNTAKDSNTVFSSNAIVVFVSDRNTGNKVKAALVEAGYSPAIINILVLPLEAVKPGLEKGKDTFTMLARMTLWKDEEAGKDYLDNFGKYGRVFRVTPKTASAYVPMDVPQQKPRGTGVSELEIVENLSSDMDTLRAGIIAKYGSNEYTYTEYTTEMFVPDGMVAYANDTDALADNRDATYLGTTSDFQLNSDDDFIIVYGLNHDKSGKSIYGNVVVYGRELMNGVVSFFSKDYKDTAESFFPGDYENADNYFVYKLARKKSSSDNNCSIIPKSTGNPDGKAYGVDNNKDIFVCFRAYYEKETGIGPSYSELFADRVIVFHKKTE